MLAKLRIVAKWRRPILLVAAGAVLGGLATAYGGQRASRLWQRVTSKADRTWHERFGDKVPPEAEWSARGYELLPHATGLDFPVRIALHPKPPVEPGDPFYYVAELPGRIRVVTLEGEVHTVTEDLLNFEWKPVAELGLMGLDIDPTGRILFTAQTYWDEDAGVYRNKVEELRLTDEMPPTVAERRVLLDIDSEPTVASYCVQFVSLGPDGNLYVGIGAGGNKIDAQNTDLFAGSIIRMDREGKALADNPFYDAQRSDGARSYIWAYGMRNPFDITWDPGTKVGIVSEVGPGIDRILKLERGVNYCFGDEFGESRMRANALYTWGPGGHFAPTGIAIAPASMFGEGEGEFLYLGLFGPVYIPGENDGKQLLRFRFNPQGWLQSGPRVAARYTGYYFSSITDVVAAHDAIYFADLYGPGDKPHYGNGIVYRIERTAAPEPEGITIDPLLAGADRGEQLFTLRGCKACHEVGTDRAGKEGPPLGDLADQLSERLASTAYESELRELAEREGAYFRRHKPHYEELLAAESRARPRLWFQHHLRDPRFDHPDGKMPAFPQLSDEDVDALADFLLGS